MKKFRILFLFVLNFISTNIFSQSLSVNQSQLNFGNVFENSPDSLQLTITNTLSRDVTVTGIKFYNTYGSPGFSTSTTWFTIAASSSTDIWIKFSPRHNIYHNSEMVIENDGLRGFISVDLVGQGKFSKHYYDATENLAEENLKTAMHTITGNGYNSLGYNIARDSMFMDIDNKKTNGQSASQNTLECIYTGREAVGYTSRTDCQTNFSFNTEHTFPQSLFTSMEPMKSDLHHLFPTDDAANNERGDNPFGIVTLPTWNNGGSLSDGSTFEPRDAQKGVTARAMFYFTLRYQNYSNFLNSQEATLRNWHSAFPPDQIERRRNDDIFSVQNNRNPFVDYPVFIERITSLSSNSVAPVVNSIDITQDTIIYGTVTPSTPVIFNYVIVNDGNTIIHLTNFNLTHSPELTFAGFGNDTSVSPGESIIVPISCLVQTTDSIRGFLTFNSDAPGQANVTVPVFANDLIFSVVNEINSRFVVYPNPATDHIIISSNFLSEKYTWTLFDIAGKKIKYSSLNNTTINLEGIEKGIYIFQIVGEMGIANRKIIIE